MAAYQPGVVVQQFMSLWDAPLPDLYVMEAHAKFQVEEAAAISLLDRLGAEMALGTVQREIARKKRIAAMKEAAE